MRARTSYKSWQEGFRLLAAVINAIIDGRHGEVTITASTATTTVTDSRVGVNSKIFLQPTSASAAVEVATCYISNITNGEFTITHSNSVVTTRTFDYKIEG